MANTRFAYTVRSAPALVALVFGALATAPSRGAALPRVLIAPFAPLDEGASREAGEGFARALADDLRGSDALSLAPEAPRARSPAALAQARALARSAEEATASLRFKDAARALERVANLLEEEHASIDFQELIEVYLSLAVARARLGEDAEVERALGAVVRLDPRHKLDPQRYPPAFRRTFDAVAGRLRRRPRAVVRIECSEADAQVALDGQVAGPAPVALEALLPGTHFLRVVGPSGASWAERIEAPRGRTLRLRAELRPAEGLAEELVAALSRDLVDEPALDKALELAGQAGADYLVLGGVHRRERFLEVSTLLLDVRGRRLTRLATARSAPRGAGPTPLEVRRDLLARLADFGEEEPLPVRVAGLRSREGRPRRAQEVGWGEAGDPAPARGERPNAWGAPAPAGDVFAPRGRYNNDP